MVYSLLPFAIFQQLSLRTQRRRVSLAATHHAGRRGDGTHAHPGPLASVSESPHFSAASTSLLVSLPSPLLPARRRVLALSLWPRFLSPSAPACRNRCTKGRGREWGADEGSQARTGCLCGAAANPESAPPSGRAQGSLPLPGGAAGRAGNSLRRLPHRLPPSVSLPLSATRRGLSGLAMQPWGAALALLLAALALLGLLAPSLRRLGRRAVGARTLLGTRGPDDDEEADSGGPADQFSNERQPLPGGCRLICKPSALAQCLLRALRRLAALEPGPRSWLSGPHLQTLCHFVLPVGPGPELAREYLQLSDDGLVALDWVVGPCARSRRVTNAGSLPAVLLVIPNAWGRLTRNVLGLCLLALERGYYPVIFHRRGHHGCPLVSPRLQPFGDPSDLKEAVTYIRFRHPAAPLFAVSEGSGSGLLLSYLGECGSSSYVTGAACISPVLRCREWFEAGLPWPYERGFLLHQKIALSRWVTEAADWYGEIWGLGLAETQLCLILAQTGLVQFGQSSPHTLAETVQTF